MKNCIDCSKEITIQAERCLSCRGKYYSGPNNPSWKNKNKCIDCGKEVSTKYTIRCQICAGKLRRKEKRKCIDCGANLMNRSTKRCRSCHIKHYFFKNGRHKCPDCGKERYYQKSGRCRSCLSIYYKTHHTAKWKEGPKCIDCGKELYKYSKKTIRCRSCALKYLWTMKDFQKKQALAHKLKPNKSENFLITLLNKNFPKEYKYVGNFQFWVNGKNPDFMNINGQKKLIELFGNYWHRNEEPRNRIRHFKKYGFNTLIIWERELKDINKLEKRLLQFHKK